VGAETVEREQTGALWALKDLPRFPWIATKVLQLFAGRDDDIEIKRFIELIRADAALGSEILRRANSVLFGLPSKIASLQHAVVILGLDHVKTLAMTIGLGAYLKSPLRQAVLRRCWRHSLCSALLCEKMAPACGLAADQGYTAGLLHDIGRFALLAKYPQPYADLLSVVMENGFSLLATEKDLFEVDHCMAGAWLAGEWNFPPELVEVAGRHHDPPQRGAFNLLKLANLSCRMADSLGFAAVDPSQPEEIGQILSELPLDGRQRLQIDLTNLRETLTGNINALE
jgi:putative nucleotidyltransferase with HDIG domain